MYDIITHIKNVQGKKRYFLSFFFGMLVTLALPPVYFLPAAVLGFTGFLWQLNSCPDRKRAFWLGWWFGWGHFTSGLYWISIALLTDINQFWWMMPFAIFGIPAVLAFYTALVSLCTFAVPQKGWRQVVLFAVFWLVAEILRGYLFTGFPWNLIGYVWTVSDSMLQLASVTGIWGLSFFTVLAFAMPVTISKSKKSWIPSLAVYSILLLIWAGGSYRLSTAENIHTDVKVRIVQGNIRQENKWDKSYRESILQKYLDVSYGSGFNGVKHIIWPESAIPFLMEEKNGITDVLKTIIPVGGTLITGSMHAEASDYGFIRKMWNSVHVLNHDGKILDVYNKHHLVPFGEYVPLRSILPIEKITGGLGDFAAGVGAKTLRIGDFPAFSPLICYEAIFSGAVTDKSDNPALMINTTNDAWYGNSSGPYQHFNMVRVRAVEQGIPLIRAANTGISGVIDSYGRVVAKTNINETTVLDEYVPIANVNKTIYDSYGIAVILFLVGFASGIAFLKKREKTL